jgi:hypothetical protein
MFDYISGANFFGEILEWCGFAVASHSLPALAFAISSCCNLGPRSVHHHRYGILVIKLPWQLYCYLKEQQMGILLTK